MSAVTVDDSFSNYVDEALVEKIWRNLDKQITRDQIRQAALEVAADFREARITTFVPIFIYRVTVERLRNTTRGNNENE